MTPAELIDSKVENLGGKVQEAINNFVNYVQEQEEQTKDIIPFR